jgi:hypothetical protein
MATGHDGAVTDGINGLAVAWSATDPTIRVLAGRVPTGSDPSNVVVNEVFVQQFHRSVGDVIDTRAFGHDQREDVGNGVYDPTGRGTGSGSRP